MTVTDYTNTGDLIETSTEKIALNDDHYEVIKDARGITIDIDSTVAPYSSWSSGSGSTSVAAPSSNSGCRSIHIRTWFGTFLNGKFYELKNQTYFCYNKSTDRVSSANPSWSVLYNDGLSNISTLASAAGYYNYSGSGSNSGYQNERTWKVLRNFGAGVATYYPRADVYVHGDGSGFAAWAAE